MLEISSEAKVALGLSSSFCSASWLTMWPSFKAALPCPCSPLSLGTATSLYLVSYLKDSASLSFHLAVASLDSKQSFVFSFYRPLFHFLASILSCS